MRTRPIFAWIPLLAATLSLSACGGDRVTEDMQRLKAAECAWLETCYGPGLAAELPPQTSCLAYLDVFFEPDLQMTRHEIDAGRARYVPDAVEDCIRAFEESACTEDPFEACGYWAEGLQEAGEVCRYDWICAGEAYCKGLGAQCEGTCDDRPVAGELCDVDVPCASGLWCDGGRCASKVGEGEACTSSRACEAGWCPSGVCEPRLWEEDTGLAAGEACEASSDCQPGLTCLDVAGDGPGGDQCVTHATATTAQAGEACWTPFAESLPYCEAGLSCVLDAGHGPGTCAAPVAVGDPCVAGLPDPCPAGHYCDQVSSEPGLCRPLPGPGENCGSAFYNAACAEGLACMNGVCLTLVGEGEACDRTTHCTAGECQAGTCAYVCE